MKYYLAPMEGLTGYVVRNAFFHNFDCFDTYFTPFIPSGKSLYKKTRHDLLPSNNEGITLVPQMLSNRTDEVLELGNILMDHGFRDLNLNLGCPSGTVSGKGRGSGFLAYPEEIDRFLDGIYSRADFTMSVKTRVGYLDDSNWDRLLEIYHKYPLMTELIIHPRTQKDQYRGKVRMEDFDRAAKYFADSSIPLCYNGDLNTLDDYRRLRESYPDLDRFMIGRGAFRRPGLVNAIRAWEAGQPVPPSDDLYRKQLRHFHDEIVENYLELLDAPRDVLFRMKEIWSYLYESFESPDKYMKKLKKSQNLEDYLIIVDAMFNELELVNLDFEEE